MHARARSGGAARCCEDERRPRQGAKSKRKPQNNEKFFIKHNVLRISMVCCITGWKVEGRGVGERAGGGRTETKKWRENRRRVMEQLKGVPESSTRKKATAKQ
jgi:hypothetical protein